MSIIELFWSRASMVSVPLGLLIRCRPRSFPGVNPLPSSTVAPRWRGVVATAIGGTLSPGGMRGMREGKETAIRVVAAGGTPRGRAGRLARTGVVLDDRL